MRRWCSTSDTWQNIDVSLMWYCSYLTEHWSGVDVVPLILDRAPMWRWCGTADTWQSIDVALMWYRWYLTEHRCGVDVVLLILDRTLKWRWCGTADTCQSIDMALMWYSWYLTEHWCGVDVIPLILDRTHSDFSDWTGKIKDFCSELSCSTRLGSGSAGIYCLHRGPSYVNWEEKCQFVFICCWQSI